MANTATPSPPLSTAPVIPASSSASQASGLQIPSQAPFTLDTTPVTLTPYTGEYFNIWKFQVQCIFRSRQLLDIIEGTELFDPAADLAVQQYWRQRDQQAMDILVQTMDCKFLPPLLGVRSSRQMWTQLLLHYDKRAT
jgi:hypothetical protein